MNALRSIRGAVGAAELLLVIALAVLTVGFYLSPLSAIVTTGALSLLYVAWRLA